MWGKSKTPNVSGVGNLGLRSRLRRSPIRAARATSRCLRLASRACGCVAGCRSRRGRRRPPDPAFDEDFAVDPLDDEAAARPASSDGPISAQTPSTFGNGDACLGELFQQSRLRGQVVGRQDASPGFPSSATTGAALIALHLPTEVGLALEPFDGWRRRRRRRSADSAACARLICDFLKLGLVTHRGVRHPTRSNPCG